MLRAEVSTVMASPSGQESSRGQGKWQWPEEGKMGIPFSSLGNLGFRGTQSWLTEQIFNKYFDNNNIRNFKDFHLAFLNVCNDLNSIMPGKHYTPPHQDKISEFYDQWKNLTVDDERKKQLSRFMQDNVSEALDNNNAIVMTGLVAPPSAMFLKRAGESVPQLKKFRLHLVPDIVFVPTCTFLAVLGVRVLQISMSSKNQAN